MGCFVSVRQRLFCVVIGLVALCAARPASAQTFRLPPAEDMGNVVMAPGSDPIAIPTGEDFINADNFMGGENPYGNTNDWGWQLLPNSLIYRSYLANQKESRLYGGVNSAKDDSTFWDATLGARVGILRYGDHNYVLPNGFQWDVEASTQVRLDVPEDVDVRSTDYRGGTQLTYGHDKHRVRFGYYHISSHLGDEFLIKHPGYNRLNFARDTIILGYSYYATPNFRLYGEIGYAPYTIVCDPWEVQFGFDWAPQQRTGIRGAPFVAMNGHLRQEINWSGNFTAQAGWAWRADESAHLLRLGVQYFNGASSQYSFAFQTEQIIGVGVWYDF
jgi:hypothetical protein